ncbi:MAG: ABC transporter permease [Alphaproteobacteria bacterium]|nr:ABC transporter permease [Alphaproteobacteria bacterium]
MIDHVAVRMLRTPEGAVGALALALAALFALGAPLIAPGDPLAMAGRPLLAPFVDPGLPLGTDRLGRSVAAGVLHGARASLATALSVAAVALVLGAAVGTIAGYLGGLADELLMRLADAVQTVPSFLLALALVSAVGPTPEGVIAALSASAWTAPARIVRAEVLSVRTRPFVEASRLFGRSRLAIAFTVVLPNAVAPVIALAAVIVAAAILSEAALAFLGLGDPNRASWGAMIAEGRAVLRTAPHVILAPGLALFATVLAVSLAGEGLSKALAQRGA